MEPCHPLMTVRAWHCFGHSSDVLDVESAVSIALITMCSHRQRASVYYLHHGGFVLHEPSVSARLPHREIADLRTNRTSYRERRGKLTRSSRLRSRPLTSRQVDRQRSIPRRATPRGP